MQKLGTSLAAILVVAPVWASDPPGQEAGTSPIPSITQQLLVVRSPSWKSVTASLQRFERSTGGPWQPNGGPFAVNVGRNGMAWGRGLQPKDEPGPVKKEGDQRAPAGAFALGPAFGYHDALPEGAKRYPYVHVQRGISCIEDQKSKYYNHVIDLTAITKADWTRTDDMLRPDGLFRWGIVVDQNANDPLPGAGSCVFLHIWRGPKQGTAGCTAMSPEAIEETIRWLDPADHPVLVQLPESEYTRLRAEWSLP